MVRAAVAACLLLVAGVGSAGAQSGMQVADEGTIGGQWMLAADVLLATAAYPTQLAARGDDACIALGYRIGTDGRTSDFQVLRQWNSAGGDEEPAEGYWRAFAEASADAVAQWRFAPRPDVASVRETYTVATLGFQGQRDSVPAQVRAHCRIDGLAAHLKSLEGRGKLGLERKEAMDRARADSAWHRSAREMLPESNADIGNRPVHRW
jgi:hypothetical protein